MPFVLLQTQAGVDAGETLDVDEFQVVGSSETRRLVKRGGRPCVSRTDSVQRCTPDRRLRGLDLVVSTRSQHKWSGKLQIHAHGHHDGTTTFGRRVSRKIPMLPNLLDDLRHLVEDPYA